MLFPQKRKEIKMKRSKKIVNMVMVLAMMLMLVTPGTSYAAAMEYGEENFGSPIQSTRLMSAVNTIMDGKPVMMAINTGAPAQLMIVDLESHTTINSVVLPYGRSFHTMVTDANGDVYMAGYSSAHLYKYSVTDKKLTDIGATLGETAVCQMTADENGNIYMATYPNAKVLKYSPEENKITEVAKIYTDDDYCKSLAYYNGALYCGGNKAGSKLVKYDINTGSRTEFETPATSEEITALSRMSVAGERLFINTTTAGWAQHWLVFDLANEQWKPTVNNAGASYASEAKDGYTYLSVNGYIYKYNLADDTYRSTGMEGARIRTVKFAKVGGNSILINYNDTTSEDIIYYDVDNNKRTQYNDVVDPSPDIIEGMLVDNGKIYASGFMGQGGGSVFDIATGKTTSLMAGGIYQAFAIKKIGDKVYFGSYPTAGLSVYDTTLPVSDTNPHSLYTHKELGNARPMDIVAAGDKIVMSVVAGYGKVDGSLIVYDTVTGENTVYSGASLLPGHSPVGLWYDETQNYVYGTTTVYGGLNSTPTEEKAKVFAFDMTTNSVVMSGEPNITPQTSHPNEVMKMCGGLAADPTTDYKLWCISDGLLFSFDKSTFDVIDQMYIDDMIWTGTSRWKPYSLEFTATGKLYANPNNDLYEIDVNNKTWTKIASGVEKISVDSVDQSIYYYYNNGTDAYKLTSVWNPDTEAVQPSQVDGWYYIENAGNFLWLKDNPSAKCILTRDIQIGTAENPFTEPFPFYGTLKSIGSQKTIEAHIVTASGNTGLFSENTGGNLVLDNIRLTGSITANGTASGTYVGGFLGMANKNTVISNCVNEAAVSGGEQTGGIVGRLFASGSISNCINKGAISSNKFNMKGVLGGIFGFTNCNVTDCGNLGSINDPLNEIAAGIGGWFGYGAKMERCYNLGNITGRYYTAGIVGKTGGGAAVTIKDCFNAGAVTGKSPSAGNVAGLVYNLSGATMENCYTVGTLTKGANAKAYAVIASGNGTLSNVYYIGTSDTDGVEGTNVFPSAEVSPSDIGFDTSVWEKVASYAYPKLIGHDLVEAGTDMFPYRIETKADFLSIANNKSAVYFLANDIELGNYTPFEFSGKFYGDAAAMPTVNVNIDKSEANQIGLFSVVSGAFKIENIRLTGSVTGRYQVGGFAGAATGASTGSYIKNCMNEASVRAVAVNGIFASGRRIGGFIGDSYAQDKIELSGLVNKANLSGGVQAVGGISGISSAKIYNCANFGNISGDNEVGGIVGWYAAGTTLSNSFNAGNISGSEKVGGFIGKIHRGSLGISDCYNAGKITATASGVSSVGAAVGQVLADGTSVTIMNSYNVGAVNGDYAHAFAGDIRGTVNDDFCYYLAPDGDNDSDAYSVSVNAMKGMAATLGNSFEASENDYIFPQIKGNINTKAVDIFHTTDIVLTGKNGVYTAEVKADSSSERNGRLILALYKGDVLYDLVTESKSINGTTSFNCTKALSDTADITAKAMFWDTDTFAPYCESK